MKRFNFYEVEKEKLLNVRGGTKPTDPCKGSGCGCNGDVASMNRQEPGQTPPNA